MNALNTQQINPGNRVDFSRIRKFSDGGTSDKTYRGSAYFDWSAFFSKYNNDFDPVTLEWTDTDKGNGFGTYYDTDKDFATIYDNFTRDLTTTASKNLRAEQLQYLKWLDSMARKLNYDADVYRLFKDDAQTQIYKNWQQRVKSIRSEISNDEYQYWNLTPEFKTFNLPEAEVVAPPKAAASPAAETEHEESVVEEDPAEESTIKDYKIPYYIPPYKQGKWTDWAHLLAIHGNNTAGHLKDFELAAQKQMPLYSPTTRHAVVTDGYLQRQANAKAIDESRARAAQIAANTSDPDKQRAILASAEQSALAAELENNAIQAKEYNQSLNNVQAVANANAELHNQMANYNRQVSAAKHNDLLNAKRQLEKSLTADRSDLLNKIDESYNKHMAAEKTNKRIYNENVNNYMYGRLKNQAYNEMQDAILNAESTANEETGVYLDGIISSIIDQASNLGLSEGDLTSLQTSDDTKVKVQIIKKYINKIPDENVHKWINAYDNVAKKAEQKYYDTIQGLTEQLGYANLYGRAYYSSAPGMSAEGLDRNWASIFPTAPIYRKKGGPIDYRWEKYIEYRRKQDVDSYKRVSDESKAVQAKLKEEIKALNQESLLLLRAIFK